MGTVLVINQGNLDLKRIIEKLQGQGIKAQICKRPVLALSELKT